MENLKEYKIQAYSLDMTCIRIQVTELFRDELEAINYAYKNYAKNEFNIYILRKTNKGQWIKVAKIY